MSLGGEYAAAAARGATFAGSAVGRDAGPARWEYRIFWPLVSDIKDREYAIAYTGLWSVSPDYQRCPTAADRLIVLVIDHEVLHVQLEARIQHQYVLTARRKSGHYEFIEFARSAPDADLGFDLKDESGAKIEGCCQ